jgi:hypothetical protein
VTDDNTKSKKSVTDYLNSLVWDRTPRIDRWLIDYAEAEDTPRVRAVSRYMLIAAVRRARQPGCKFDQMPVITGPQGCGKSSALRMLAIDDAWFTDAAPISSENARQIIEATAGKWIVEASELSSLDAATLKEFLSRSYDEARPTYQRECTRVPRQFVVFGTTSATPYLQDTSNRRLWPVSVKRFNLGRLVEIRDQLWAEAANAEAAGEPIQLDSCLYDDAVDSDDPIAALLYRALGDRTGTLRIIDAYRICGIEPGSANQDQIKRVGWAIRELGWQRARRLFRGQPDYVYVKGASAEEREVELTYDAHMRAVRVE